MVSWRELLTIIKYKSWDWRPGPAILKFKVETWQQDDEFVKFIKLSHLHISMQILHTVSYTFYRADNENLFNNQELLGDHFLNSCDLNVRFRDDTARKHWMLVTAKEYRVNSQGKGPGFLSETMLVDIRFVCFPPVRIVTLLFRVFGNVPFELLFYFYFSTCFHIIKDIFPLKNTHAQHVIFSYPVLLKNHKS